MDVSHLTIIPGWCLSPDDSLLSFFYVRSYFCDVLNVNFTLCERVEMSFGLIHRTHYLVVWQYKELHREISRQLKRCVRSDERNIDGYKWKQKFDKKNSQEYSNGFLFSFRWETRLWGDRVQIVQVVECEWTWKSHKSFLRPLWRDVRWHFSIHFQENSLLRHPNALCLSSHQHTHSVPATTRTTCYVENSWNFMRLLENDVAMAAVLGYVYPVSVANRLRLWIRCEISSRVAD